MPSKDHSLNVLLDQETLAMLRSLAKAESVTMATIIRRSIRCEYAMRFNRVAACADGQRCFVPHMHQGHSVPAPAGPGPHLGT